jgi:hypothetical protein
LSVKSLQRDSMDACFRVPRKNEERKATPLLKIAEVRFLMRIVLPSTIPRRRQQQMRPSPPPEPTAR